MHNQLPSSLHNAFVADTVIDFAESQHEGQFRDRPNLDGTPREYICHPLEVAFIAASYEIALRKQHEHGLSDAYVVNELVLSVREAAMLSKEELKDKIIEMVPRLDREQLREICALILHDVIEKAYKTELKRLRKLPGNQTLDSLTDEQIEAITTPLVAQIANIFPGVEDLVLALTDKPGSDKATKGASQASRARLSEIYAKLKSMDNLANTHDQAFIPLHKRPKTDMLRKTADMCGVVVQGCALRPHLRHIQQAYDIIYQDTMRGLDRLAA